MNLWNRIAGVVETGNERAKFDLKRTLDLSDRAGRAHFVKDVLAMANTREGPGYIILGVLDTKERTGSNPEEYVVGYQSKNRDEFLRLIMQALDYFCEKPIPDVHYEEIVHPQASKTIGVVIVERAYNRPYKASVNGDKLTAGEVYLRRGTDTFTASPQEIQQITEDALVGYRMIVNFGRGLEHFQIRQAERLAGARVDEIINAPDYTVKDELPHQDQLENLVRSVGLTRQEWEALPLLVNIHPFAPDAAGILAQIHGLRGHFPPVLRMVRNAANQFDVVEILDLQGMRNRTRDWGAKQ